MSTALPSIPTLAKPFVIGGCILAVLMAIAVVKFVLYLILDCCIDLDGGRRRRQWAAFWFSRNVVTPEGDIEVGGSTPLPPLTREMLMDMIPAAILTKEDLVQQNDKTKFHKSRGSSNDNNDRHTAQGEEHDHHHLHHHHHHHRQLHARGEDDSFPCSICLNEMKAGEKVFKSSDCHHAFHYDCFLQWVVTSTAAGTKSQIDIVCPNCRTPLQLRLTLLESPVKKDCAAPLGTR